MKSYTTVLILIQHQNREQIKYCPRHPHQLHSLPLPSPSSSSSDPGFGSPSSTSPSLVGIFAEHEADTVLAFESHFVVMFRKTLVSRAG